LTPHALHVAKAFFCEAFTDNYLRLMSYLLLQFCI